jgi:hypothetical protein
MWEMGEATEEEVIALFQDLIDWGLLNQLQGYYGRAAKELVDRGLVFMR